MIVCNLVKEHHSLLNQWVEGGGVVMGFHTVSNPKTSPQNTHWLIQKVVGALRSGSIVANEVYPRRDYC